MNVDNLLLSQLSYMETLDLDQVAYNDLGAIVERYESTFSTTSSEVSVEPLNVFVGKDIPESINPDADICKICYNKVDNPVVPCRCEFMKVHVECLPDFKYTCSRCQMNYEKCVAITTRGVQCAYKKLKNSSTCKRHRPKTNE